MLLRSIRSSRVSCRATSLVAMSCDGFADRDSCLGGLSLLYRLRPFNLRRGNRDSPPERALSPGPSLARRPGLGGDASAASWCSASRARRWDSWYRDRARPRAAAPDDSVRRIGVRPLEREGCAATAFVSTGTSSTTPPRSMRRTSSSSEIGSSSFPRLILMPSSQMEMELAAPPSRSMRSITSSARVVGIERPPQQRVGVEDDHRSGHSSVVGASGSSW